MRAEVAVSIPVGITALFATLALVLAGVALYHDIYWQRAVEDDPHFQEMLTWMEENEAQKDLLSFYRDLFYQVVVVFFFIAPTVFHLIPYLILTVKSRGNYEDSEDDELETPDEDPDYLIVLPAAGAPANSSSSRAVTPDTSLAHHHPHSHHRGRPSLASMKNAVASPIIRTNKSRFRMPPKSWAELRHSYEKHTNHRKDNGVSSSPVSRAATGGGSAGEVPSNKYATSSSDASKPRTKWRRSVKKITAEIRTMKKSMYPYIPSKPARSIGFKMDPAPPTQNMNKDLQHGNGIQPSTIIAHAPANKPHFHSSKPHLPPRRFTHMHQVVKGGAQHQRATIINRAKPPKDPLQQSTASLETEDSGLLTEPVISGTTTQDDDLSSDEFEEDRLPFLNERVMKLLLFTATIFESMSALCACFYQLKVANEFQEYYESPNVTQRLNSLNDQMRLAALMLASCSPDSTYLDRLTSDHQPLVKVRDDLHVCQDFQAKEWSSILCALYAVTGAISTFTIYWQYRVTLSFVDGDTASWRREQNKAEARHSLVTVVERNARADHEVFMDPALALRLTQRKESFSEDEKLFSPFSQFQGVGLEDVKARERQYGV